MEFGIMSLLPPLLAILLALILKNVFVALFSGVFLGYIILADWNIFKGFNDTLYAFVKVFESNSNTIVIIVCALLGGLTLVMEKSGGINGFVDLMTKKKSLIKSKRGSLIFTWLLGVLVFTSGTVSCLITGAVSHPLNDAMKVSREKQAFFVHSTSTPVCVLLPLSGWGAFMIGLLEAQGISNAPTVLMQSIPFNFYCIIAVAALLIIAITGKDFGPMKLAEEYAEKHGFVNEGESHVEAAGIKSSNAINMLAPLGTMIVVIIAVMAITGQGNLLKGSGYAGILWGVALSLLVSGSLYIKQKIYTFDGFVNDVFQGVGNIFPVVSILIFAFAMGTVVKTLDTGNYLASLFSGFMSPAILAALVFVIAAVISFATGTSMGTHAVMMPLAMPLAMAMGSNIPLIAAAVFGGGIFGDHASPISDTTALSSATTNCDPMKHIKTQLPYCLTFAAATVILYLVVGIMM